MNKWNPDLYLKYEDERTQPVYDLISKINITNPENIIDIGCGPGNSTRILRERWPAAHITGLDSSSEMIEKARSRFPQGDWLLADAAEWHPAKEYSIVFSNAALQWLPHQERLIKVLFGCLQTQGVLAVQVPANSESPLHKALLRVSKRKEWKESMVGCDRLLTYHDAGFYYDQLTALTDKVVIWQQIYYHVLDNHQGLIDWYASTGMKSYLEKLTNDTLRLAFQAEVLEECRLNYPVQANDKILFPFQRLFFVASK